MGPLENESSAFGPAEPWKQDRVGLGTLPSLSFFIYYLWIVDGRWRMADGGRIQCEFSLFGIQQKSLATRNLEGG